MRVSLLNENYGMNRWWVNFSEQDRPLELMQAELAQYGATFDPPFMHLDFSSEDNYAWFLLRWG